MSSKGSPTPKTPREDRILLLLFLTPIASWSTVFGTATVLSGWVCGSGQRWVLPVVLAAAFAVTALAGAGSFRRLRESRRSSSGDVGVRRRFLEEGGVFLSLIALLAIVALAIPALLHRPCD